MGDAEVKDDEPAIRALGSLFKLTEVFLWDDGTTEIWQPSSVSKHIRFKYDDDEDDNVDEDDGKNSSNAGQTSPRTTDNNTLSEPEDLDLTEHMSALGLPLAFSSSKERCGTSKGKRKGKRIMNRCCQENIKDEALGSAEFREEENLPNAKFHVDRNNSVCVSFPCQSDQSCHNVAVDIYESSLSLPEGEIVTNLGAKSTHDENVCDSLSSYSCCLPVNHESIGSNLVVDISAATTSDLCSGPASSGGCMLDKSVDQVEKGQGRRLIECVNSEDPLSGDVIVSKELGSFVVTEQPHFSVSAEHFSDVVSHEEFESSGCNGSFGDWRVFGDSFYMRNFFYNVKTCESTWDPPPGMENFAFANVSNTSSDSNAEMAEMDVERIPSSTESVVVNPNKTGLDEEYCTGDALWVHAQLANEKLSSDVDIFSYSTCVGNVSKLHEPDESHVGEVSISSSLDILECKLISETGTTQVGSFASLGGHLQMKFANEVDGFDSLVNNGEIACCNDDGGAIAQSPEAGSLLNAASGAVCSQTFIHHVCSDRMEATVDGFDTESLPSMRKQKKKARKARLRKKSLGDDEQLQFWCTGKKFHVDISKYWCQRYLLFSRFDHGVKMDEEGWFSVTPEPIARHQASRCGGSIIIDGFAGVGGNAIQFAKNSKHVIAIDIDPKKIEYSQHNAGIYGVEDQIDFINGDSLFLAPKLKADTVFLSPPWGGPDYLKVKTYDIMMLKPYSGQFLFDTFRVIASRVVMFLPRNVNLNQLAELSLSADPPWSLEVEKNFLNGKLKAVTAYFSKTIV
ncbi:hypothetical protein Ancab_016367 [Ancistrocladus abbreviatus]